MSENVKKIKLVPANAPAPTRAEAEEAVKTLLRWAGDDPMREGLLDTPKRVAKAFEEYFAGYEQDPREELGRTFEDIKDYEEIVLLRDIMFESHCEHHLAPIIGRAHVAYLPNKKIVGISKLARVVEIYAKRLQSQEVMTMQIAKVIDEVLEPRGVAVMIEAEHHCMSSRGVHKPGVNTITTQMLGSFRDNPEMRGQFMALVRERA